MPEDALPANSPAALPITQAGLKDLRSLSKLEKAAFNADDAWPLIDLIGVLTFPDIVRLKIEADRQLVAFIAVEVKRFQRRATVLTIAVAPPWQGKGLGERLLKAGEDAAGMPVIRLTTRRTNDPAISLYQKTGYKQVDVWERYYSGGEDGLVFEKHWQSGKQAADRS